MKSFILLQPKSTYGVPYDSTKGVPEKGGLILIGLFLAFVLYIVIRVWASNEQDKKPK